jgi:hypothetical protein
VGLVDLEGGAEFSGAVEEVLVSFGFGSSYLHRFNTFEGDGGADEDCSGGAGVEASDAEHPVVAVGEIGVGEAGSVEHDSGSGGHASIGVAAGVSGAVGFGFDDSGPESGHDDVLAEEVLGGLEEFGVGGVVGHWLGKPEITTAPPVRRSSPTPRRSGESWPAAYLPPVVEMP